MTVRAEPPIWLGLGVVFALAAVVRLTPVVAADFPLNDGGLFFTMIEAIRADRYGLPETVAYNGLSLPFVYPPAALFLGAAFTDLTGTTLFDTLRILPVAFSLATVPAAFLVYRQVLRADALALLATAAFALIPRSYEWLIGGGGITRAPGQLFALIAIAAAARMYDARALRWPVLAGIAGGVATLCHPESGVFAAVSILVLAPFRPIDWRPQAARLGVAAGVGLVCIAPWLLLVVARHGVEPLLGGFGTAGALLEGVFRLFTFRYTDGYLELYGVVAALGLAVCLLQRQWLLPIWTAVIVLIGSRASLTYASIPVAGAVAVAGVQAFRLIRLAPPVTVSDLIRRPAAAALVGLLLVAGSADSLASAWRADSPLQSLSADQRAAMHVLHDTAPPEATVLVLSGEAWPTDAAAEWLPVLAGLRSSSTVQGSEWIGTDAYVLRRNQHSWLLNCTAARSPGCVDEWSRRLEPIDYVFETGPPCCRPYVQRVVDQGGELLLTYSDVAVASVAR